MMFGVVAALALVGCGPSKEDLQDQIDDAESRSSSLGTGSHGWIRFFDWDHPDISFVQRAF